MSNRFVDFYTQEDVFAKRSSWGKVIPPEDIMKYSKDPI